MLERTGELTELMHRSNWGDHAAENEWLACVLPNLWRSHYFMKREPIGRSPQPTEPIDQIDFKLVAANDRDWRNRAHFFAIGVRAMRRYLIDLERAGSGVEFVPPEDIKYALHANSAKLDLAVTVDRLNRREGGHAADWRMFREMKRFTGLTSEGAAECRRHAAAHHSAHVARQSPPAPGVPTSSPKRNDASE